MTFILIAFAVCVIAFVAWEATRLVKGREAAARRRVRMSRGSAKQKAWDLVFGRRVKKRLSYNPAETADD